MTTKNDTVTHVRFNVGGKSYEVSRSLLDQYPDTMLTRMASEAWTNDASKKRSADGEIKPMFIERDGERFRYVLDYMRDSQVILGGGENISKEAIYKELEYYGFQGIAKDAIQVKLVGSVVDFFKAEKHYQNLYENRKPALALAYYCHRHFLDSRGELKVGVHVQQIEDSDVRDGVIKLVQNKMDMDVLRKEFADFGLKFISCRRKHKHSPIAVAEYKPLNESGP